MNRIIFGIVIYLVIGVVRAIYSFVQWKRHWYCPDWKKNFVQVISSIIFVVGWPFIKDVTNEDTPC